MGFTFSSCGRYIHLVILILRLTTKVNGFEVQIVTDSPVVEFGDSLEVTCSTTCADPVMTVEYKPGIHPNRTQGDDWITDRFSSVQKWDFTVPCSVICKSENNELEENKKVVTVYNRELNVTSPPEVLEVNKTYNLECTGPRVYPKNKLILAWLRGSERIQNISTEQPGFPDEDNRLHNVLSVTASTTDDGQVYTCLAELDLGSNTTKPITNYSVILQTYSFPESPRILDRDPVEVHQEVVLTCEVPNVYPAEKMRVRWFKDGEEWNSSRSDSTIVRATTTWTPQETGLTELICTADIEDYPSVPPKNDSISIEMYVFSDPEIQVPTSTEGIPVNITCSVFNVSGELQLRLKKGGDILVDGSASTELTIYHTVHPQAELNGQQYTCEAELTLQSHSHPIVKQQSATLKVQYPPKKPQISGKQDWIVGKMLNLTCFAEGNPVPQVHWTRDGKMISGSEILHIPSVQLGHGGQYMCTASNEFGFSISSLHAEIFYKPQNTTISINNKIVSEFPVIIGIDDEITMTCHCSGNPQATLEWNDPTLGSKVEIDSPGVLRISRATSEHQGIYKCRARNVHGTDEKQVEIRMKGETWLLVLIILVVLILLLLILAAVFLIYRARKTGHYKVLNATPNKNQEIPRGSEHWDSFPLKEVSSDYIVIHNHTQTDSTNTSDITPVGSKEISQ